jgi:putative ABC transport system substrate-binding protein
VRRRQFITLLGGAAAVWPIAARAQPPASLPPRVGILAFGHQDLASPPLTAFREEMRKIGYVEGQNYVLEFRSARGDPARLGRVAAELAQIPVDVIVTDGGAASMESEPQKRRRGHVESLAMSPDLEFFN